MKYTLYLEFLCHTSVEVEANSKEKAIDMVMEMTPEQIFGKEVISVYNLEDLEVTDVEKRKE